MSISKKECIVSLNWIPFLVGAFEDGEFADFVVYFAVFVLFFVLILLELCVNC